MLSPTGDPTLEAEAEAETTPTRKRSKNNLIAAIDVDKRELQEQVIINAAFLNEFSQ